MVSNGFTWGCIWVHMVLQESDRFLFDGCLIMILVFLGLHVVRLRFL